MADIDFREHEIAVEIVESSDAERTAEQTGLLAAKPTLTPAPLLSALVEPHLEKRRSRDHTREQVIAQERMTLRLFIDICGDRPISDYGRGDVTLFLDTLRQMPKTHGKSLTQREQSARDIIAATPKGTARLSDKTIKRHLSAFATFLRYPVDNGYLTQTARREMTEGHRFRIKTSARDQRDAWTIDELKALFASPVWTGRDERFATRRGPHIIRDARFWIPLLALFHGARLEEIAGLRRSDIEEIEGIWLISLTEIEPTEDERKAGARRRTLKTAAAARKIPIHPELIRIGFLDYVRSVRRSNAALFPDVPPQGADGKRAPRFTRDFGYYRKVIGVYRAGIAMHSFRHNASTRLLDVITTEAQKRAKDFFLGHARTGTEGDTRYDKGAGLRLLADVVALLQYPELDFSHLYVTE